MGGLCSFLFINVVTRVLDLIIAGKYPTISKGYVLIFIVIILFVVWIRKTLSSAIIYLSQTFFWKLRNRILSSVLHADYRQLADKKVRVHTAIVSDVNVLTHSSLIIIDFFTSSILAVTCLIYLSFISLVLFSITLGIALIGITIYHASSKKNIEDLEKARLLEDKFQKNVNTILDGFKEIYMEPQKGKYIYEHRINPIGRDAFKNNTAAYTALLRNQITGQILFYILISSILLFFSLTLKIKPGDTVSFIFTLLYLLSAIETIMVLLPDLIKTKVASVNLMNLINELETANANKNDPEQLNVNKEFNRITIRDLEFHYGEYHTSFGIGPINMDIRKGEVIFIYGGNGSGKTTLFYAILGLCIPSKGEIRLNATPVTSANYAGYRAIFSVVFSDFYLFDGLLHLTGFDLQKWDDYLRLFELEDKVHLQGNTFSSTNLSLGQRKRLALIAALLEEKPVLVLDEWAADQDPYFRKKFYTEIIPLLKKNGITVVAITHDDTYYHCADKLYRMDYGKLMEESNNVHAAGFAYS
jgi:putative ATP-binding cassette transporter